MKGNQFYWADEHRFYNYDLTIVDCTRIKSGKEILHSRILVRKFFAALAGIRIHNNRRQYISEYCDSIKKTQFCSACIASYLWIYDYLSIYFIMVVLFRYNFTQFLEQNHWMFFFLRYVILENVISFLYPFQI